MKYTEEQKIELYFLLILRAYFKRTMTTKQQEQKWFAEFIRQKLTKEEKEEFYSIIKDIVTGNEGSVWEQHKEEHKEKMTDILGYIANDIQDDEEQVKEWTEYEVESGYMIDGEITKGWADPYDNEKEAKEYYDMLVNGGEYDYVWLVERTMEGEDCMSSETIEEWSKTDLEEEEVDEDETHYIVYGEWKLYDDKGEVVEGIRTDDYIPFTTKEEALKQFNKMIKNKDDNDYDLIYLDIKEKDDDEELDQDNIEFWERV